ncbi:MAG TPA: serine hydrolase [Lachnospiraceae bacterium]|uniref:penicillin-binding transpeptidase domain-containing protein n=1 Tax=Anaerosporobacter sp. TaxID=1872529 RepID=UPI000EF0BA6E|nr:penicillin-binding transpeptidase domain-containing protein [Anaerosporobacter sp.]HAB59829.1 serine hydrolase [Lachnospiraceae bacterium]
MKKTISLILMILLSMSLVGCASDKSKDNETDRKVVNEENSKPIEKEIEDMDSQVSSGSINDIIVDYSDCFENISGCAVFYSPNESQYTFYNKEECETKFSPFSTFKIVSTLIGLNNNVIHSENSTMGYDGTIYPVETWNEDLTLKAAFKSSCIWYFRKVIDKVGFDEVQKELNELQYGNCDISEWEGSGCNPLPELNGFWLESSLKISPKEQVDILNKIFNTKNQYSDESIKILKKIMQTESSIGCNLYGKTGTGASSGIAWYVGLFEKDNFTYYFAIYLDDDSKKNISGSDAKEIAEKIIEKYYLK